MSIRQDETQSHSVTVRLEKLQSLAKLSNDLQENARSVKTKSDYASDWKDFSSWCEQHGLSALPANEETVAAYLSDRASNPFTVTTEDSRRGVVVRNFERLKPASLRRRLEALCDKHRLAGQKLDRSATCIANTLKGIDRTFGKAQKQQTPLTTEDIRKAVVSIDIGTEEEPRLKGLRDRTLILIGFIGAFRRSELVALEVEDLCPVEEGLEIIVRRSKTDQQGSGMVKVIPYSKTLETCPIRTLERWLRTAGISSGPIFRGVNRHGKVAERAITPAVVSLVIKDNSHVKTLSGDYTNKSFSAHSLRAGFCTSSAMEGASIHSIMKQTDHKTPATTMKYIRVAERWKENAATTISL